MFSPFSQQLFSPTLPWRASLAKMQLLWWPSYQPLTSLYKDYLQPSLLSFDPSESLQINMQLCKKERLGFGPLGYNWSKRAKKTPGVWLWSAFCPRASEPQIISGPRQWLKSDSGTSTPKCLESRKCLASDFWDTFESVSSLLSHL